MDNAVITNANLKSVVPMESRKIKLGSKNLSFSHQHHPEDRMSPPVTRNTHSIRQLHLLAPAMSHQATPAGGPTA